MPSLAVAGRNDHGRPSFAESIISMVNKRLCDRQHALAGRLPVQLIHPSKCFQQPNPDPEPTVTLTADPMTIDEGESALLEWDSTDADECVASGGWSGTKSTSGSQSVSPSETTTYHLECEGDGGSESDSVTVNVNDEEPDLGTLIVRKLVIRNDGATNATTTFSFKVNNGATTTFETDGENSMSVAAGTYSVVETAASGFTTTYNNCSNVAISDDETEICTITNNDVEEAEEPTVNLTASRMTVIAGSAGQATTTLSWDSSNATSCTASNGWSGSKAVDGTETATPTATTTYTITCTGEGGSANDSVTVNFQPAAPTTGTLIVRKLVIRNDGATNATTTFSFKVNNGATTTFETDGENSMSVATGTYTIVETAANGFTTSYNNCSNVTISNGETEICTITNNDVDDVEEPTVELTASRMTVFEGSQGEATTTLSWDSSNATECTASNGWSGTKAADGTETVTPTATTTYAISCTGDQGSANDSITVNFVPEDDPMSGNLLITEVHYDLATTSEGVESANEWVELHNGTNQVLNLEGYSIHDATGSDTIPAGVTLQPGQFLVITASSTTASFYSIPVSAVVLVLPNLIGSNGLANTGDMIEIFNTASSSVDKVSWGSNTSAFTPSVRPTTADDFPGKPIGRISIHVDTGSAADWETKQTPTPGQE